MKRTWIFKAAWLLLLWGAVWADLAAQVDFRYYQSAVRTAPDSRHTCGCAVAGMLENFAGVPSSLDGQAWEAALGGREDLATGMQILSGRGLRAVDWPAGQGAQPLAEALVVKTGNNAQSVEQLKSMLDKGVKGVVVRYRAALPQWDGILAGDPRLHLDAAMQVRAGGKLLPWKKAQKKYPDLALGLADSSMALVPRFQPQDMGEQAVLVVGYDNLQGFLVKHCRGVAWGMQGYAWVDFDYHRHMAIESATVLLAQPTSPPRARQSKLPLRLRLKCLPEQLDGKRHLQLSVWIAEGGVDQPWKSLHYQIEGPGLEKPVVLKPLSFSQAAETGYPVFLPMEGLPAQFKVRVLIYDEQPLEWGFEGVGWRHGDYGD